MAHHQCANSHKCRSALPASQELAKLVAYFTEDDEDGVLLDAENLWAEPVDANSGGGTYRLTNIELFLPFAPGDVVRAQLNGHSRLAVVGVESLSDRCAVTFIYDGEGGEDSGDFGVADESVDMGELSTSFARSLETHGVHVEGPPGMLCTSWPEGWGPDEFKPVAEQCMAEHPGWWPGSWYTAESRVEEIERVLDASRDVQPEMASPEQAAYWAADDPGWEAIGVTDASTLATMQMMAVTSRQVFATIQAGRHQDGLTYWERLWVQNPNDLPPLGRPLLIEPNDLNDESGTSVSASQERRPIPPQQGSARAQRRAWPGLL